jgi:ferredoxin
VMPENYIGPIDLMGDAGRREEKFAGAKKRIPAIAQAIRERRVSVPEGSSSALVKIAGSISSSFATTIYNVPGHFHATSACIRCMACVRICPTRNITMTKGGASWGTDCTQCYACIHWCPAEAIEIGGRTKGKPRYHHPDVSLGDMQDQRGE